MYEACCVQNMICVLSSSSGEEVLQPCALLLQGSVFFPIPDGTGIMFNLSGTSDPPRANNRITREVPCKTNYIEILPVENWLKKPQRWVISLDVLRLGHLIICQSTRAINRQTSHLSRPLIRCSCSLPLPHWWSSEWKSWTNTVIMQSSVSLQHFQPLRWVFKWSLICIQLLWKSS